MKWEGAQTCLQMYNGLIDIKSNIFIIRNLYSTHSSFIMASNFGDLYSMAMVQTGFNLNLTHQIDANMIIKPINFYAFGR